VTPVPDPSKSTDGEACAVRADAAVADRDYRCLDCGEAFSRHGLAVGVAPQCPACGSRRTREHWESRVRNAGKVTAEQFEELRDRPG
jgi:DNA-directed RNA polymerase subunit RPC12/RpoP